MHAVPEPPLVADMLRMGVIGGTLQIAQMLNRCPDLCADGEVVLRFAPDTDLDLRHLLDRMQEVWEFDPTDAVLTRSFSVSGGKARAEIDVSALGLADVLAILDETRPTW